MGDIGLTEAELLAFERCSGFAVKCYVILRGRFDVESGVTGLSFLELSEWSGQHITRGKGVQRVRASVGDVLKAIGELERRGLLVSESTESLDFSMPLAPSADA